MAKITITDSNPTTGELELSDGGRTKAKRKETITWKIGSNSGVKSISNIYPKTPMPTPFFSKFPHRDGSSANWKAVIDHDAVYYSEYNYSISWIPNESDEIKEHDPIISIKPSDESFLMRIIKVVTTILIVLFGISILFSDKKKRRK
jgi:hypothetical protein